MESLGFGRRSSLSSKAAKPLAVSIERQWPNTRFISSEREQYDAIISVPVEVVLKVAKIALFRP